MFAVSTVEIDGACETVIEVIVIQFELIDGGGLPRVGFCDESVIDGGQADSSLVFCHLREEGLDSGCFEHYR